MYLSKIQFNPNSQTDSHWHQKIPHTLYKEHQSLWKLFDQTDTNTRPFLYRREQQHPLPLFYVLSEHPPQTHPLWQIDTKAYHPRLQNKQQLAFTLRINPVVTHKPTNNTKLRQRHDIIRLAKHTHQQQHPNTHAPNQAERVQQHGGQWLQQRAEQYGFQLQGFEFDNYQTHRFKKKNSQLTISTLDYQGILKITQVDDFMTHLYQGIGRARSFGCGLMLIRRP